MYNLRAEWAPSDDDTPHSFNLTLVYEIPQWVKGNNWAAKYLTEGWQLNNIVHALTGFPLNVTTSSNLTNALTGTLRADCIGPVSYPKTMSEFFTTSGFAQPADYTWGTCGHNTLRGPAWWQWDFSLSKNTYFKTPLNERTNFQFRAEAINFLNHPNWASPDTGFGDATFGGGITYQVNTARTIDVTLRLVF
jgi:hypothetical protein